MSRAVRGQTGSEFSGENTVKTKVNRERHRGWWRYPFCFPHPASPLLTPHPLPGLNKWQEKQAGQSCADWQNNYCQHAPRWRGRHLQIEFHYTHLYRKDFGKKANCPNCLSACLSDWLIRSWAHLLENQSSTLFFFFLPPIKPKKHLPLMKVGQF